MSTGALTRFPADRFATWHDLDAFVGVALPGADGTVVGHLGIMGRECLEPDADELAVLRIFAARAAAEIERRRHLAALRARDAEVAEARSRMVESADHERRRIGRDLHDGAQQRVVAHAVLPFGLVGADVIADTATGEDPGTWRADYRAFYDGCREELALLLGEPGWRLTPMRSRWSSPGSASSRPRRCRP